MKEMVDTIGNGKYPVNNGEFKILVKDRVVITVLNEFVED